MAFPWLSHGFSQVLYFLLSLFVVLVFIASVSTADGLDFLVGVLTAVLRTILVTPWLGVSFFLLVMACVEVGYGFRMAGWAGWVYSLWF